jgi:hypothetical protein
MQPGRAPLLLGFTVRQDGTGSLRWEKTMLCPALQAPGSRPLLPSLEGRGSGPDKPGTSPALPLDDLLTENQPAGTKALGPQLPSGHSKGPGRVPCCSHSFWAKSTPLRLPIEEALGCQGAEELLTGQGWGNQHRCWGWSHL